MQISLKWQGFPWRSRKGEEQEKEHAPDYGRYSFRKKEILINGVKGIGAAALLSWFFYHSFWAMLPLSPIVFFLLSGNGKGADPQTAATARGSI